jgi:hypothetical protein
MAMAKQTDSSNDVKVVEKDAAQSDGRELESALKDLERWAADESAEDDKAVQRLVRAIKSRQNLTMWANKDIDTFLPEPKPRELAYLTVTAQTIFVIRNVLVFVPIYLTWSAIGAASTAFSAFSDIVPAGTEVNFLRYWQTGGEGLIPNAIVPTEALVPDRERLSAVAALVAIIIFTVIALTLVASVVQFVNIWQERPRMRAAEQRRIEVVLALESALHGYRQATPTSISETLAESLSALLQAAHQLGATAQQLERSTVGVSDLGPAIAGFTEQLASAEERFDKGITPNLARLATTVETISGKLNTDFEKTLQQSLSGLGQLSDRMQNTVFTLEVATQEIRTNIEQILARLKGYAG